MHNAQVNTWLDTVENPGPFTAGPLSARLPIEGIRSISDGAIAGKSAASERAFFKHMRETYGGTIDPKAMTDEQLEKYLAEIKDHPSAGMSTIARLSQIKSKWSPIVGHDNNDPKLFANYLDILSTAPCMQMGDMRHQEVSYSEENYDELIQNMSDFIIDIMGDDVSKKDIIKSLTRLAKAATSNKEKTQTDSLFAQNAVVLNPDKIGYQVSFARAQMTWKADGKAEIMDSSLTVYGLTLGFSSESWKSGMYSVIGSKQYRDDNEWIDSVGTAEGANQRKLCIEAE